MSEPDVQEVREQVVEAFEGADYPVNNPMELLPALPNGPATTFESGDWSMSIMELQNLDPDPDELEIDDEDLEEFGIEADSLDDVDMEDQFPVEDPETLADQMVMALQVAGELPMES